MIITLITVALVVVGIILTIICFNTYIGEWCGVIGAICSDAWCK